jgi:hypothetical protein
MGLSRGRFSAIVPRDGGYRGVPAAFQSLMVACESGALIGCATAQFETRPPLGRYSESWQSGGYSATLITGDHRADGLLGRAEEVKDSNVC